MQQTDVEAQPKANAELTCPEAIVRTALYSISAAAITVFLVNNGRQVLKLKRGGILLPTVCALAAAGIVGKVKMGTYIEILRSQKASKNTSPSL